VFALPPASAIFKLAKKRGYLAAGPSPAGTCGLIKQVAALSGDRVTIGVQGVQVNGVLLKNSAPRPANEAGRPLRAYELSDYALRSEEVLLMSDYNPASASFGGGGNCRLELPHTDPFCGHMVTLPNGDILAMGGEQAGMVQGLPGMIHGQMTWRR
jgi:hypothetical protein